MKEAVTKVIDTLTQEDFNGAFQKLMERYNKCIAAGGDYFEGDYSFMCVLSIKVPIRKKSMETYLMHLLYDDFISRQAKYLNPVFILFIFDKLDNRSSWCANR